MNIGSKPHSDLMKYSTTQECLDKCIELFDWFVNAPFYRKVRGKVSRIETNLNNMKKVVVDHQRHKEAMERVTRDDALNTSNEARAFLQRLMDDLSAEEGSEPTPERRPITHAVNMILAPRVLGQ